MTPGTPPFSSRLPLFFIAITPIYGALLHSLLPGKIAKLAGGTMTRTLLAILFLLGLLLSIPSPLRAQRTTGRSGGIIDVQVRYANGQRGPRGIHVRLESAEGGPAGDCETVDGGKCQFSLSSSGVYLVRMSEHGYKEVIVRVELIGTSRGYAVLELTPLPSELPAEKTPSGADNLVAVDDLSIPEKARQEFAKGESALKENNFKEAARHFQKSLKIFENFPQAYRMLGETCLEQQDWKSAETYLQRSIELDPNLAAAYVDLGAVRNQTKNYAGAEEALKAGLKLSPGAAAAKYELAKTYWAMGRWQDASPYAKEAATDLPKLAPVHVLLGNILLKERNPVAALSEYEEYLKLDPAGAMAPQVRDIVAKIRSSSTK